MFPILHHNTEMVFYSLSDLFRALFGESVDEDGSAIAEKDFEGVATGGGRPDCATDVACGDGVGVVGGLWGGGFPAEARGVETETAVVFGEVEVHVVELCGLVVCHHRRNATNKQTRMMAKLQAKECKF